MLVRVEYGVGMRVVEMICVSHLLVRCLLTETDQSCGTQLKSTGRNDADIYCYANRLNELNIN